MELTTLGRTGLRVSTMGLGCGGPSRLGLKIGATELEAENVVRSALALGINFIDTAEGYGTEEVVGRAIRGMNRDQVVLSTKAGVHWNDRRSTGDEMKDRVEASLRRLGTDHVEIFHLHGISSEEYEYARDELLPAIRDLQAQGKVRFIGITEAFGPDPGHEMLRTALKEPHWDVVMLGFNVLNQSARERVLAATMEQRIGTLCMFAVRRALSRPEVLREVFEDLVASKIIAPEDVDMADPLGFVVTEGGALSVTDAGYRFCRWEPGIDVVLSGTGNIAHLRENAASLERPALPPPVTARLRHLFAGVDGISGN